MSKQKDKLRIQMVLLAEDIKAATCPKEKARLLKLAQALIVSSDKTKRDEAVKRVDYLRAIMPKMFIRFPDALQRVKDKSNGHEKFLPHYEELVRGQAMQSEINTLVDKFKIELVDSAKKKPRGLVVRNKRDKFLVNKRAKKFATAKFDKLKTFNTVADNKEEGMEVRRAHNKGKANYVMAETGFNGTRRNDKPTNDRLSWNEKGGNIASAKGAR